MATPHTRQQQSKHLRPIYNALDLYQYNKAYKLTHSPPQSSYPITTALRAHASERCGGAARTLESLLCLRELLAVLAAAAAAGGKEGAGGAAVWGELEERIWLTRVGNRTAVGEEEGGEAGGGERGGGGQAVRGGGGKGKGKKGGRGGKKEKAGDGAGGGGGNSAAAAAAGERDDGVHVGLDLVDVLDLTSWRRTEILEDGLRKGRGWGGVGAAEAIVEEATLATIAVTLRSLRLHQTLAQMYTLAAELLSSPSFPSSSSTTPQQRKEELCTTLIQGYLSHLCVVADLPSSPPLPPSTSSSPSPSPPLPPHEISTIRNNLTQTLTSYERAQSASMQLFKHSGSNLHRSWCAHATLGHLDACRALLSFNDRYPDNDDDTEAAAANKKKKLEMKIGMLPRLAESIMGKVVEDSNGGEDSHPPSADDWSLYLQCLTAQNKTEEAIGVLTDRICCYEGDSHPSSPNNNNKKKKHQNILQIDDENDVQKHLGSLIRLTERQRLERIAECYGTAGRYSDAAEVYGERLLVGMPDQWCYWMGLLGMREKEEEAGGGEGKGEGMLEACERTVADILERQGRVDPKPRVPLRGPYLFRVEMAAFGVRRCHSGLLDGDGDGDGVGNGLVGGLCDAILEYGKLFAPLVSCCFQDLRPYLGLLVDCTLSSSSSKDGGRVLSDEVVCVLEWAKNLRVANDPSAVVDGDEKETKRIRRERLRAYIASVKIMFEIWFQLTSSSSTATNTDEINHEMEQYTPSANSMLHHWKNALNLGSNPADGGQKECLPGDDLILLTAQLLLHRSSSTPSPQQHRTATSILTASLYEQAILLSPYNPNLKIAALSLYASHLHSPLRSYQIYQTIDVRQIQLDSCSYLILPHLIPGALYGEAARQCRDVIALHSSCGRDVGSYMGKSFENGNLEKGREIMAWGRGEMRGSWQLMEAKGLVMDLAPLLCDGGGGSGGGGVEGTGAGASPLGGLHGICGGDSDIPRAEKMVHDSDIHYAAPSLLRLSSHPTNSSSTTIHKSSDNRDLTIHQFEILHRTDHYPLPITPSLLRSHLHGILVRAVLVVSLSRPPKRGKIVVYQGGGGGGGGDPLEKRSRSLLSAVGRAQEYCRWLRLAEGGEGEGGGGDADGGDGGDGGDGEATVAALSGDHHLQNAIFTLGRIVAAVTTGLTNPESPPVQPQNDTLKTREALLLPLLENVTASISAARRRASPSSSSSNTDEYGNQTSLSMVATTLADHLVTVFSLVKTVANLFSSFGWGKRKRSTKRPAGGLADVAVALGGLVADYLGLARGASDGGDDGGGEKEEEEMVRRTLECLSINNDNGDNVVAVDADRKQDEEEEKEQNEDLMGLMRYLDTDGDGSGKGMLERVVGYIVKSRECTKGRVGMFLVQMAEELKTFDVD